MIACWLWARALSESTLDLLQTGVNHLIHDEQRTTDHRRTEASDRKKRIIDQRTGTTNGRIAIIDHALHARDANASTRHCRQIGELLRGKNQPNQKQESL